MPRRKRPTSTDVARAAGVSQTTVSFVLNDRPGHGIPEETRQRVLEAARRLDYRPHATARSLARGRSDIAVLAIPGLPIGAGISRFVEGLAAELAAHGLTLVTHLAGGRGRPLTDVCAEIGASAVIGFEAFDDATVRALYRAGADVVIPSSPEGSSTAPIGRFQARHLIERGHRRLGYALPRHPGLLRMAEGRLRGVAEACAEAGLAPPVVRSTDLEAATAAEAVAGWRAEAVTGVCAFNDETAIAVLAGLREHGLTAPADLAVVGVDDIPTARLADPPLTTISFDLGEVVRRRAAMVVAGLAGREPPGIAAAFDPRLIQRPST
ncbi:LacI family transcriptional regulator [Yinghuangia sp. ASG 101]|uniref:LacI family DNA-binding transcriptional regulator n=1 Tax=Yinghuangia sp. ASG 101 TaxID=2896848 RepID=UPI001E3DB33D|nr:LacI family DNA-binding transcriptional regulator [Yinghuangia sp. ASG 101]UGQ12564.1 LacI family transcriptional regulator [Yinghuangia sp. ASG 101]